MAIRKIKDGEMLYIKENEKVVEITRNQYDTFFDGMPPALYGGTWFLVGEPFGITQTDQGASLTFVFCFYYKGRCYAAQPVPLYRDNMGYYYHHMQTIIKLIDADAQ